MKNFLEKLSFICICSLITGYSGAGAFPADGVPHLNNQDAREQEEVRCPSNMLFDSSENACECDWDTVYYPPTDSCFYPFKQGPCEPGQYLAIPKDADVAECIVNICGNNGTLPYNNSCYSLWSIGPCKSGELLLVSSITFEIQCFGIQGNTNAIIDGPVTGCVRGTKRIATGECKKPI